ncbi:MAG: pyridoxal phosphate-dependent aminotransferase family protein [Saprospiraceae bacterium]
MDIFERIKNERGPLGQYAEAAEGYYIFPKLTGELGNKMYFKGKEVIMWSINDYLGLANHPEVREVDGLSFAAYGLAYPMGARMMSGNTEDHDILEKELAEFVESESAVLVNFGYQGIFSAIDCILSRRDVVVYDADCHACIVDGLRLHLGKRFSYLHNDITSLEKHLAKAVKLSAKQGGGVLVITEGVFGMQGEQGKLRDIVALKSRYDFRLLVDDAHGFGTQGKTGAGTGEEQGVQQDIDIYFSTFAKAMGSIGAFFAGDQDIMQFLKYNMRSQIFAKSMPMGQVIGNRKRLQLLKENPSLKDKLWENVNMLQSGLKNAGFDLGNTNSCVTPVFMHGSVEEATALVQDLRENFSIFCSIVVYPVIPKGRILLRLIPTASHTDEDISYTIDAFVKIKDKLRTGKYQRDQIIIPV